MDEDRPRLRLRLSDPVDDDDDDREWLDLDLHLDRLDLDPTGGSRGVKAPLELELAEIAKLLRDPNQDGTLDLSVESISALVAPPPPALELLLLHVLWWCERDDIVLLSKC